MERNQKLLIDQLIFFPLPVNISTLGQCCGRTLKYDDRWSNVKNEAKSEVGFSELNNADTTSMSDVKAMLKQRWHNFISTLFQRGFNFSKSYIKTSEASDKFRYVNG